MEPGPEGQSGICDYTRRAAPIDHCPDKNKKTANVYVWQTKRVERQKFQGGTMKRLTTILLLFAFALIPVAALAAGSCTTTPIAMSNDSPKGAIKVTFTCTGDAADGSIPNTAVPGWVIKALTVNKQRPYYLYQVKARPTGINPTTLAATANFIFVDG